MSGEKQIPALHRAIVAAAVKAALGQRAIVREIVEVPARTRATMSARWDTGFAHFGEAGPEGNRTGSRS